MDITWKSVAATVSRQIGSATKAIRVGGIIVNSHTTANFKFIGGTATGTAVTGSYSPATGSSVINFQCPLDFAEGCYLETAGTLNGTVLYREIN